VATADDVFAYTRSYNGEKILVVANFSDQTNEFAYAGEIAELWIDNGNAPSNLEKQTLQPYQAFAVKLS
ncbi:MAG: alpha-glucosidase C-terminal domain-containing protein, partial [Lactobacillaceae bacterium]|nr:alpha-glucosidase C-terminal domain-containing protein [Lactobacillaceae bacterium]